MSRLKLQSNQTPLKLVNNIKNDKTTWNLCFVNASIQTIHRITDLKDYFKSLVYEDSDNLPVCREITRIFKSEGKSLESTSKLRKLVGESSGLIYMSDGSQQDLMHFHDLLLTSVYSELTLKNDHVGLSKIGQFYGMEKNEKKFFHTRDGKCSRGHSTRTEEESFQVIQLAIPETDQEISLNNIIVNHYAEHSSPIFMKCSDCCPHKGICPQTGDCKLMEAVSQRTLITTPKHLYIQLWRFPSHQSLKVETRVIPENRLVLPNEEKFKLMCIVDHLGSRIKSGHYLALIKSGTKWTKCNDEKISKTELKRELGGNNYLFVYEKIDSVEPVPSQLSSEASENYMEDLRKEKVQEELTGAGESFSNFNQSPNRTEADV